MIFKNLTNYEISVQNNFSFNEKIFEKFITILQCPCYRNISLKPKESKMISIEFFYHILVNESTLDELSKTLSQNNSLIIENKNSGEASIINNTQLTIKK